MNITFFNLFLILHEVNCGSSTLWIFKLLSGASGLDFLYSGKLAG